MSVPMERRHYTYRDYMAWPENERVELIHGDVYVIRLDQKKDPA